MANPAGAVSAWPGSWRTWPSLPKGKEHTVMHNRGAARGRHQHGPWLAQGLGVEGRARYLDAEDRLWRLRGEAELAKLLGPRGTDPRQSAAAITAVRRHAGALLVRIGVRSPGIPRIEPAPETPLA